jgi:hypothetical protein
VTTAVEVRRTEKKFAHDLEVGDVIAASLSLPAQVNDYEGISVYTIVEILDNRLGEETMTVKLAYQYRGGFESAGTRIAGLRRLGFVTVV